MIEDRPYRCTHWGDAGAQPAVFLHGFPEHGGAWDAVAQRLADRFHCIAPDLRGYGGSYAPADQAQYSVGQMIPDIVGLIADVAGGRPVHLVAHDWGAALAYVLAARAPDLIARFAVLNGVHPYPFAVELAKGGAQSQASQYINYLRRAASTAELEADGFAKLFRFVTMMSPGRDGWLTDDLRAEYRAVWAGRLDSMIHWYRASQLAVADPGTPLPPPDMDPDSLRITMPHHIIWGRADTALLPVTRDGVIPLCDDVQITEIEGCDHWLHHQNPQAVAEVLRDFLS